MAIDDNASYELTGYQVKDLASKIRAKADSNSLASVATSGLYSDLTGAPTIPTVYNGTLTIQQNGTTLGTFTANQSSNETINITAGGGGASATKFYSSEYSDNANVTLYKDTSLTTHATYQEVIDALQGGGIEWVTIDNSVQSVFLPTFYKVDVTSFSPDTLIYVTFVKQSNPIIVQWNTVQSNLSSNAVFGTQIGRYTLPTASSGTLGGVKVGNNLSISSGVLSANAMTGATSGTAGTAGYVPAPAAGDQDKVLKGDGTWGNPQAQLVEMSYGESNAWAKFLAAYQAKSIVYCGASSNANPGTGAKTRRAFMAYVNDETTPTEVEFQYVRSVGSKTSSQPVDQVFVYKLTSTNGGTWSVQTRDMAPKLAAGTGTTVSYSSGSYTINAEPDYSASEVDTKVKWVDGKTIYRKTIHTGTLPNASNIQVAHGISYSSIIKVEGIAQGNSNLSYTSFSLPFSGSVANSSSFIQIWVDATNITISTGSDRSGYDSYVTLYYTKSS